MEPEAPVQRLIFAACAFVLPGLLFASVSGARADAWPHDWGSEYGIFNPDHGAHNYCFDTISTPSAGLSARMTAAMNYLDNATDAVTFESEPCDKTSTAGQTDVAWRGERIIVDGDEVIGFTRCARRFSNGLCDRYVADVNGPLIRDRYDDDNALARQYWKTSCHELGHTVGLYHFAPPHESCQLTGWVGYNTAPWIRTYTSHHINHLNDWF